MALEGLQLRSLVKKSGELELSLAKVPVADPAPDEIVVRVEASPINPSDLGLLIGPADLSTAVITGSKDSPIVTAKIPEVAMRAMAPAWMKPCLSAMKALASSSLPARLPKRRSCWARQSPFLAAPCTRSTAP